MISIDKKILDPDSRVARRMIAYGEKDELFIFIPDKKQTQFDLSPMVHVCTSGGMMKMTQLFSLISCARRMIQSTRRQPFAGASRDRMQITEDRITTQDPFFTALGGWLLKKKTTLPLEIQIHGDFFGSEYYRKSGIGNVIRYWLGRYLIHKADRIRVVGERVKRSLEALGIPSNRIEVRPIVVDAEAIRSYVPRFSVKELHPGYKKYFLCLGRFDPVKNVPWLVEVFAEAVHAGHRYALFIVGDGAERKKIEETIKKKNIQDSVFMKPWTEEVWSYLKTADCLLFPSVSEGYGLGAVEASAADCPVIMNEVGVGNYEVTQSDRVHILPMNDRARWKEAMLSTS